MPEFLEMRSFEKGKEPSVAKIERDADNMYHYARYVIILNEEGQVVQEINRKFDHIGKYLVVLAPITYKDVYIPQAVVLEIGFHHSTPYKQFSKGTLERTKIVKRIPVAKLKDNFMLEILPLLAKSLQTIVDYDVSHRATLSIVTRKGNAVCDTIIKTRGKFIRINKEEEILAYVCLARDIETRSEHHINRFVKNTIINLSSLFGKKDCYTDEEIKKQKIGKDTPSDKIAYFLNEAEYPTHIMKIVREKIIERDNKTSSYIELFDQILRVFKIKTLDTDVDDQKLYVELNKKFGDNKEEFLSRFPILIGVDVRRTTKRKKWRVAENKNPSCEQAENCIIVEVKPSRELLLDRGELKEHETHT